MQVGTKDLKNRLSFYLRRVRLGEVLHVTDRGTPVAEIRPVAPVHVADARALQELERDGIVTLASGPKTDFVPVRSKVRGRAAAIVIEDRK
jgi:prevent-host-death family protein